MSTIERWKQRFERERTARREAENLLHDKSRELYLANETLAARADELVRSMEQLKNAQDALVRQEKLAALGALVAGVAHEVNTPLGVAVTAVSLAGEAVTSLDAMVSSGRLSKSGLVRLLAQMSEGVELAEANLRRAAELIHNFKKVAVDQSSGAVRAAQTSELVAAVVSSLSPLLRRSGVDVHINCIANTSVYADAGGIGQILTNLIQNSCVHAFDESSTERRIEIHCADDESGVTLKVMDNGRGMTPDIASRVWEPFFTTRRGDGGSGLGMHIIHTLIVERFHGTIDIDTAPNRGCHWRIFLPYGTPALYLDRSAIEAE